MSASAEYRNQDAWSRYRSQAWNVWTVGLAIVAVWTLAIIVAPIARAGGASAIANPLYSFFHYICHQMPERSFHILGEHFGVCSRCFGVYFGIMAGFAAYPLWRTVEAAEPLPRFWLFLSIIPISIDWSLTVFGIWENTQASRFVTGVILGFACATFIIPAAVEITRNATFRRRAPG